MPPVEAPSTVLTMARATTPPSPGWLMVVWGQVSAVEEWRPRPYLGATVEGEEAEDEDEAAESRKRHGVARHVYRGAGLAEPGEEAGVMGLQQAGVMGLQEAGVMGLQEAGVMGLQVAGVMGLQEAWVMVVRQSNPTNCCTKR